MDTEATPERVCSKCKESKPLDAVHFAPHKECRAGLISACRVCEKARINARNAAKRALSKQQVPLPTLPGQERVCTGCGESKPLDAAHFKPHPFSRDGLLRRCRGCERVYDANYVETHRDRRNEQKRARRCANPQKTKAERKRNHARYKEKEREYNRAWKERNPLYRLHWERARAALFKRLLPLAEAAALIGVQEATVRTAMREQRLAGLYRKHQWWVFKEEAQAWKERRDKGPQVRPTFSLDAAKEGCGSFHEWIGDPKALNPLQAVMLQESVDTLLSWVASELAEEEQIVLLTYADSAFDERAVATALNKPVKAVRSIIQSVQRRATQTFGQMAA